MTWLKHLPWGMLIVLALFLGLAPFHPEPHLVGKLRMLAHGDLRRPIDIFDLCLHGAPFVLIILKLLRN